MGLKEWETIQTHCDLKTTMRQYRQGEPPVTAETGVSSLFSALRLVHPQGQSVTHNRPDWNQNESERPEFVKMSDEKREAVVHLKRGKLPLGKNPQSQPRHRTNRSQ